MLQQFGLLLFFICLNSLYAQDERLYRQILSGELAKFDHEKTEVLEQQFSVKGAQYFIDLNGDGVDEVIRPQKRDGVDWIEILNIHSKKIFEAKLFAMGGESSIYKIKFVEISPKTKLLVLFLDEGKTQGRHFESTSRINLLTFENNDFSTMHLIQGPHHFHEKQSQREQYFRRHYSLIVEDINKDGVKEVVIRHGHIQRIMVYKGFGEWERF